MTRPGADEAHPDCGARDNSTGLAAPESVNRDSADTPLDGWHPRLDNDLLHVWLRQALREIFRPHASEVKQ